MKIVFSFLCLLVFGFAEATTFNRVDPPLVVDFSLTNVDSTGWFSVATTGNRYQALDIFQDQGSTFYAGFTTSEDPSGNGDFILFPAGNDYVPITVPASSNLYLKATHGSGSVTSGRVYINPFRPGIISTE